MKKNQFKLFAMLMALVLFLAACGGNDKEDGNNANQPGDIPPPITNTDDPNPEPAPTKKDPVTLNFFYNGFSQSLTDQVKEMIENKFDHVTINMILHATGSTINDVLAAGTDVDLAAFTMGQLFNVMDLQLATDMTELIQKHNFDLNNLADGVADTVKGYSEGGKFLVMPYELNNSVLLYNKNIFDKFGVDFPVDDMTWDDVLDITKKVTREDNGVQYSGFVYTGANPVYKNQLGLQFIDPATDKASINNDGWKRWLDVMTSFYKVEGNEIKTAETLFFSDQTLAMRTGPNPLDRIPPAMENGLEWDAVTVPTFQPDETTGSQMNAPFYIIPPKSRDKDTAFEVIAYLMSDEVQAWNAKQGRVPIIKSNEVIEQFGADLPFLEGTNYAHAVFNEKIAAPIRVTKYDGIARNQLSSLITKTATEDIDLNTALREAEEAINKAIEEAKN